MYLLLYSSLPNAFSTKPIYFLLRKENIFRVTNNRDE